MEQTAMAKYTPGNEVFNKNKLKRWLMLAYGTLMMMCVGICYAWTILNAPIAKEFAEGWDEALGAMVFTFFIYSNTTFGVISGLIISKLKTSKVNILISAVIMFSACLVVSLAKNFALLYIGFSFLGGLGSAFTYNSVISTLSKWFKDRIGVATGMLLMGYGVGSFVLGNVYTALLNVADWRVVFIILGIAIAVILSLGAIIISSPPADYVAPVYPPKIDKHPVQCRESTPLEMIKRPAFWFLFFSGMCAFVPSTVVSVFGRQMITSIDPTMTPAIIALVIGLIPVANGAGRIFTGWVNDFFGMGFNIRISAASVFVSAVLVMLAMFAGNIPFLIVAMMILGFSSGMSLPDCAIITRKFYGEKHYQVNFQVALTVGYINSWGATLVGVILTATGGFTIPLILMSVLGLMATIFTWCIRKP